ncbi:MAG: hypothetical protein J4F47_09815 [Alphaproteobacteria bacterium]|nr:hypothetical protein [Alphaproteobacteria bacterium]
MSLRAGRSEYQAAFQGELFPALEEALGPLPERSGRFVQVLEFVLVAAVVLPAWPGGPGRLLLHRRRSASAVQLPWKAGRSVVGRDLEAEATIWSDALCRLDSWYRADRSWKLGEAGKTLN